MPNSLPFCRVCLKTAFEYIDFETPIHIEGKSEFTPLNSVTDNGTPFTYMDCFRVCTQLDAEFGANLCDACGVDLLITFEFLRKAKKADEILHAAAQKINIDESADTHSYEIDKNEEVQEKFQEIVHAYIGDRDSLHENEPSSNCVDDIKQNEISENTQLLQLELYPANGSNHENCGSCIQDDINGYDYFKSTSIIPKQENIEENQYFQCDVCPDVFNSRHLLVQHLYGTHKTISSNCCKICKQEIYESEQLLAQNNMCSKCDYRIMANKLIKNEHGTEVRDYLCKICSKMFISLGMLNAHLKCHKRKATNIKSDACEICGKQFSTQYYLRQHMKLHYSKREVHQCEHCEKIYVSKTALDNHIRFHKGETVECTICGKQFVRQYELQVHMRFHTKDYPFECDICHKKFAIKGHLRTHMWRHQGLKLQCEDCGKLFSSTKALQEHSFVHTTMPYPCSYCTKGYPSKQKYKIHLKTAHSIKLNDIELQKIESVCVPKALFRKKLTLVQVDGVTKKVKVDSAHNE